MKQPTFEPTIQSISHVHLYELFYLSHGNRKLICTQGLGRLKYEATNFCAYNPIDLLCTDP